MKDLSVNEFLNRTASNDPVPGGGSVACLCGALAASLGEMVASLTTGRKKYADHEALMNRLIPYFNETSAKLAKAINEDADSYRIVMEAYRLPKDTDEEKAKRSQMIAAATLGAATVPFRVARIAADLMYELEKLVEKGNVNCLSDTGVAIMTARTAAIGALMNVYINLAGLNTAHLTAAERKLAEDYRNIADESLRDIMLAETKDIEKIITKLTDNE